MSAFDNATLMITGGTGSFGSTVLKHFLDSDLKEIHIFSRDEKKQDDMRHELQAKHPENAKKVMLAALANRNAQFLRHLQELGIIGGTLQAEVKLFADFSTIAGCAFLLYVSGVELA